LPQPEAEVQPRHGTGPVHPIELLETRAFVRRLGQDAHLFVTDYAVHHSAAVAPNGHPTARMRELQMESE
jgi:hypothetical protein